MWVSSGVSNRITFTRMRRPGPMLHAGCLWRSTQRYYQVRRSRRDQTLPSWPRAEAAEHLFRRNCPRVRIGKTPLHFRDLFVRQPQFAPVLLFHELDHVRHVSLPLRRPRQHPIEDCFDLISCHARHYTTPAFFSTGRSSVAISLVLATPRQPPFVKSGSPSPAFLSTLVAVPPWRDRLMSRRGALWRLLLAGRLCNAPIIDERSPKRFAERRPPMTNQPDKLPESFASRSRSGIKSDR